MPVSPPADRDGFDVAVICALPLEAECVQASFDEQWDKNYGKAHGDHNAYTLGVISGHNVVLAHMPEMGKVSAATVAAGLRSSFRFIRFAFIVGICGAAPFGPGGQTEIILGDVVISETLVQYDIGKQYPSTFQSNAKLGISLTRPGSEIRSMLAKLKITSNRVKLQDDALLHTTVLQDRLMQTAYPGPETDKLYKSSYIHRHRRDHPICDVCQSAPQAFCVRAAGEPCDVVGCDPGELISRHRLVKDPRVQDSTASMPTPEVHLGRIGSADTVMKSAEHRDRVAEEFDLIAFEMEGAGAWDHFQNTLVIKGVCDYADSHKNKQWQYFAAATAASCLKALLGTWGFTDQVPGYGSRQSTEGRYRTPKAADAHIANPTFCGIGLPRPNPFWHVPFVHRNLPTLVGRTKETEMIESTLFGSNPRSRVALLGLGGIGKTRLALEIAEGRRTKCSVFWVQAKDAPSFESDYSAIAKLLKIPGLNTDGTDVRRLVPEYLDSHFDGEWVMILDNADDPSLWYRLGLTEDDSHSLVDYLPKGSKGSVLITTRNRQVALTLARNHVVELPELGFDEAKEMLTDQLTNPRALNDAASTQKLLEMLTCLPLAIIQSAAYMNRNDISPRMYLRLLSESEEEGVELLNEDFNDEGRYSNQQNPITTTWLLSFKQIQDQNPVAAEYLAFMSCIGEKNIPYSILPKLCPSRRETEEALGVLKAYSFLRLQGDDGDSDPLFDMHRLVRLSMRNWLRTQNMLEELVVEAATHLNSILPAVDSADRQKGMMFAPHVQILCGSPQIYDREIRYELLLNVAPYLLEIGKPGAVMKLRADVVRWCEENLGKEGELTIMAYNHYSRSLLSEHDWESAMLYSRQAFEWHEKTYGIATSLTINPLITFLRSLCHLGKSNEAQKLCERVLGELDDQKWEDYDDNLPVWQAFVNIELAAALQMQGQVEQAERLVSDVVKNSEIEDMFGGLLLLTSLHKLAQLQMANGKFAAAEQAIRRLITIHQNTQRDHHPAMAAHMSNLVVTLIEQGRYDEAAELLPQVLDLRMEIHDQNHPRYAADLYCLGYVRMKQGRKEEAIEVMTECVGLRQKLLNPNHPEVLESIRLLEAIKAHAVGTTFEYFQLDEMQDNNEGLSVVEGGGCELVTSTRQTAAKKARKPPPGSSLNRWRFLRKMVKLLK